MKLLNVNTFVENSKTEKIRVDIFGEKEVEGPKSSAFVHVADMKCLFYAALTPIYTHMQIPISPLISLSVK